MFGGAAKFGHQGGGSPVVQQGTAGADILDCLSQVHPLDVLDDIAARAGQDRVQHRLIGRERRQHQATQIGQPRQQISAQFDAVAVRKSHVQDSDVGSQGWYPRHRLRD